MLNTVIEQLQKVYGTTVSHVCFSPLGGWFIKYGDGTAQLSGRFPDAFYAIANSYMDLSGPAAKTRQPSKIDSIFFGSGKSVVVKAGTVLHWDGITQALADSFNSLVPKDILSLGFTAGPNTVLCPWSNDYYFIEAIPILSGATQYAYELPTAEVTTELLQQLTSNVRPPEHMIPAVSRAKTPLKPHSQPPTPSVPPASDVPTSLHPPPIPANMRARYEKQFDVQSGNRDHLPGAEAARILLDTGLDRKVLSDIWELIDEDRNGKLDREEFVQAMWQVDTRRTGKDATIRWAVGALTCDGCSAGLNIGENTYFCSVCNDGDFDLCFSCYVEPPFTKRCKHALSPVSIQLPTNVSVREVPGGYAVCDGCQAQLTDGTVVYCCNTCNGGDYDICEACWKWRRTCGHPLSLNILKEASNPAESTSPVARETPQPASTRPTWDAPSNTTGQQPSDIDKLSKQFNDSSLKDSLLGSIVSTKPNVKWEDVAGLETAKAELQEAIIFPLRFPQMFRGKRQARRALLLYGPPGTGKSYLAKAVATEVDHTLFSVSSGDVMSKWTGESEGLMRQLFILAREKKPSIIFIDEIDALCGKRDSGGANAEDTARMKTEFLVQMDGLGNDNDGVFVLAATNLPWSLDPAVRRRFQKRIHVPLPDEPARSELFKVHLGDMSSSLGNTENAFRDLALRTPGFSGSDIANLVQDALMMPVKKVHTATYFRKFRDREGEWYTPCNPGDNGAIQMKWNKVPARQLKEPALALVDLYDAVHKTKPSVGEEEVRKCSEWTQQYGMEGA